MEQIDYAPLLPEKPLTDIVSFARQSALQPKGAGE